MIFENKINNMLENVSPIAKQNFENSKKYLFSIFDLEDAYLMAQNLEEKSNNLEKIAILKAKQKLKEEKRLMMIKNEIKKMNLKNKKILV